jgi:hypothetical protein
MGDNLERTNDLTKSAWSTFEVHGNVALKNASGGWKLLVILLHFYCTAL